MVTKSSRPLHYYLKISFYTDFRRARSLIPIGLDNSTLLFPFCNTPLSPFHSQPQRCGGGGPSLFLPGDLMTILSGCERMIFFEGTIKRTEIVITNHNTNIDNTVTRRRQQ